MRLCKYAQARTSRNRHTDERTGRSQKAKRKKHSRWRRITPDAEWRRQYFTAHMTFFSFFFFFSLSLSYQFNVILNDYGRIKTFVQLLSTIANTTYTYKISDAAVRLRDYSAPSNSASLQANTNKLIKYLSLNSNHKISV